MGQAVGHQLVMGSTVGALLGLTFVQPELVPEAPFGASVLYGSSPFCAAIMASLSSPVTCSLSVWNCLDTMERTAVTPLGVQVFRACAASASTPASNLEVITPTQNKKP